MGRLTRIDWAVVLVSAPVAVLAVGWLAVLGTAFTGQHPIWTVRPRNLSEAAAFRDGGAVVRRIWEGEHAAAPAEVQKGFISDEPVSVTPIEAAVEARRPEILQLLFDLGATLDARSWTKTWCLAEDTDIRDLLARHRPPEAAADCGDDPLNR